MPASDSDAKPAEMYGIRRGPVGWKVDIRRQTVSYFKHFTFSIHGGEGPALLHAQAWRNEIVRTHPPQTRAARADTPRRNNSSGVTGVTCTPDKNGVPQYWHAKTYLGSNETLSKCFSVRRYGAQEAKVLAIAERQKQLQHMIGLNRVHPQEEVLRTRAPQPLPASCPPPLMKNEIVRSTSKSGISGVRFHKPKTAPVGWWIAVTYTGLGSALYKSFPIKVHGDEGAKMMAIAERQRQLEQLKQMRLERVEKRPPHPPLLRNAVLPFNSK